MKIKKIEMSMLVLYVAVFCVGAVTTTTDNEEIPDFEFDDNFSINKFNIKQQQPHTTSLDFNDFDDFFIDDGDDDTELDITSKEKNLKDAILRALSTRELKYKFSEVLPLLRHLSRAQRMVFSSIISAQIGGGRSFTFDEVCLILL